MTHLQRKRILIIGGTSGFGLEIARLSLARALLPLLRDGGTLTFAAGSDGRPDNASDAIVGN